MPAINQGNAASACGGRSTEKIGFMDRVSVTPKRIRQAGLNLPSSSHSKCNTASPDELGCCHANICYLHLSDAERDTLSFGLAQGHSLRTVVAVLERPQHRELRDVLPRGCGAGLGRWKQTDAARSLTCRRLLSPRRGGHPHRAPAPGRRPPQEGSQ
jgi:hypothetical protein